MQIVHLGALLGTTPKTATERSDRTSEKSVSAGSRGRSFNVISDKLIKSRVCAVHSPERTRC